MERIFSWVPELATNIKEIDRQHQQLCNIVNSYHFAVRSNARKEQVEDTLTFLASYTCEHFAAEEALMRQNGYPEPERGRHLAAHAFLAAKVSEMITDCNNNACLSDESLALFLEKWLIDHILKDDLLMAKWLKSNRRAFQD